MHLDHLLPFLIAHLRLWQLPLTYIAMALQSATLAALLYKRMAGCWPSLLATFAVELITAGLGLTFLNLPHHNRAYYATYWIGTFITLLFRIWIAIDIWRSFQSIEYLPRWLVPGTAGAGILFAIIAAYASWHVPSFNLLLLSTTTSLSYAVTVGWAAFYLVMLLTIRLSGIGWTPVGTRIMQGLVLRISCDIVVAAGLTSSNISHRALAGALDAVCEYIVLLLWITAILAPPKPPAAPPLSDDALRALKHLQHFAEQQES